MAIYEGSGEGGATVQDYDFLGHDEASATKYDFGLDCAGMGGFRTGVVGEGCKRGMNHSEQSLGQVGAML